jgi:hypothetical protein
MEQLPRGHRVEYLLQRKRSYPMEWIHLSVSLTSNTEQMESLCALCVSVANLMKVELDG